MCQFATFKMYWKNVVFSRVSICDLQNIYKKPGFFKGVNLRHSKYIQKTRFFQGCQFVTFKIYTKNQVFSMVSICDFQNIYKKPGFFKGVNLRFSKYIQKTRFFQLCKFATFKIYTKNHVFSMFCHFIYKKPGFSR